MMFSLTLSMLAVCFVAANLEHWCSVSERLGLVLVQLSLYLSIVASGSADLPLNVVCMLLAAYHLWRVLMTAAEMIGVNFHDEVRWF